MRVEPIAYNSFDLVPPGQIRIDRFANVNHEPLHRFVIARLRHRLLEFVEELCYRAVAYAHSLEELFALVDCRVKIGWVKSAEQLTQRLSVDLMH